MRRRSLGMIGAGLLLATSLAAAPLVDPSVPAEPATRPSGWTDAQIREKVTQLADEDSQVRDLAAQALMGLDLADLPRLLHVCLAMRPLEPAQIVALHDVVDHDYLASESYSGVPGEGFAGIRFPEGNASVALQDRGVGVIVSDRLPGFSAYRFLRNGDLIVGIQEMPEKFLRSREEFVEQIQSTPAGQTLHLQVLRGGRLLEVALTLQSRPAAVTDPLQIDRWTQQRVDRANEYWKSHFSALEQPDDSAGT